MLTDPSLSNQIDLSTFYVQGFKKNLKNYVKVVGIEFNITEKDQNYLKLMREYNRETASGLCYSKTWIKY